MTTSHTPGPWTADKLNDRCTFNIFATGFNSAMCQVSVMENSSRLVSGREVEANAKLIAAAPELLAALKWALAALDASRPNPEFYDQPKEDIGKALEYTASKMEAARAAIAKATS